jgi:hypothetical protein
MDFTKTIKSLKLFLATVLVGSASLSANAYFRDSASGLCFTVNDDGATCSVSRFSSKSGDIVIPSTVTYNGTEYKVTAIGSSVFESGTLTSITIPASITSIGRYAFYNCTALTRVNISDLKAWCEIYFFDQTSNPLYYAQHLYLNGEEITGELIIPEGTTTIGQYAFYCWDVITSVSIPESVTSIGEAAFFQCESLSSVTFSEGLQNIGNKAFCYCKSLESIKIPNSVKTIEDSFAFANCSSLKYLDLGEGVETIGQCAFQDCTSLKGKYIGEDQYVLKIPDSVKNINYCAFGNCESVVYLDLGEGVETIDYGAFRNCDSLKGTYTNQFTGEYQNVLIIPNSVTSIGTSAFAWDESLENIWIGNGCTSIGEEAFRALGNLKTVSCMANPAPIIAKQNTFDDTDYTNAYLYIPAGETDEETKAIYDDYVAESNYWRLFLKGASTYGTDGNGISVGVGEVANDDIAVTIDGKAIEITGYEGETSVYNVAGMKVYQGYVSRIELTNPGIYVVIVNGNSYKVAIK